MSKRHKKGGGGRDRARRRDDERKRYQRKERSRDRGGQERRSIKERLGSRTDNRPRPDNDARLKLERKNKVSLSHIRDDEHADIPEPPVSSQRSTEEKKRVVRASNISNCFSRLKSLVQQNNVSNSNTNKSSSKKSHSKSSQNNFTEKRTERITIDFDEVEARRKFVQSQRHVIERPRFLSDNETPKNQSRLSSPSRLSSSSADDESKVESKRKSRKNMKNKKRKSKRSRSRSSDKKKRKELEELLERKLKELEKKKKLKQAEMKNNSRSNSNGSSSSSGSDSSDSDSESDQPQSPVYTKKMTKAPSTSSYVDIVETLPSNNDARSKLSQESELHLRRAKLLKDSPTGNGAPKREERKPSVVEEKEFYVTSNSALRSRLGEKVQEINEEIHHRRKVSSDISEEKRTVSDRKRSPALRKSIERALKRSNSSSDLRSKLKRKRRSEERDELNNDRNKPEYKRIGSIRGSDGGRRHSCWSERTPPPSRSKHSNDLRNSSYREDDRSRRRSKEKFDALTEYSKILNGNGPSKYELGVDAFISNQVSQIMTGKATIWCCNFCGIASHRTESCPESQANGSNPKDPFGAKVRCVSCDSFNHLVSVCPHSEHRGSNEIGKNGKKFQCNICESFDHLTSSCPKVHSEKYGRNKRGITGRKLFCDVCNSFNHLGQEHGKVLNNFPSCDQCGEYSHSSVNCPQRSQPRDENFRWNLLSSEVGSGRCSWCQSLTHRKATCPNKHLLRYGCNPRGPDGNMVSCGTCGSYSHQTDDCFDGIRIGRNRIGPYGSKIQCITCLSYNHEKNCNKRHLEKFGSNPTDMLGRKQNCDHCGSYDHFAIQCPHHHLGLGKYKTRCNYCGSYQHNDEKECLEDSDVIRDFLRQKIGVDKTVGDQNRWKNMQRVSTKAFVEEISEEEKQEQIAREKMMMERLKIKSDPNYVPESSRQSPATTAPFNGKEQSPIGGNPHNLSSQANLISALEAPVHEPVYNEPDPSIFLEADLRTDRENQPQITSQLHNDIVTALTSEVEQVVSSFKIHITKTDLYGLTGQNWINDKIVEMYMQMVAKRSLTKTFINLHKPRIYCMSTYFFLNLIMRGYDALQRWTKDVDIFSFDVILIPIHLEMHWCVAVVDFRCPGVFYYDSMAGHNMPALSAILNYLKEEHLKRKGMELDLTNFAKEIVPDCPQQENGADCGIFACKVAEFISRDVPVNFSQDDMPYYRKRMVWEIVKQQLLSP